MLSAVCIHVVVVALLPAMAIDPGILSCALIVVLAGALAVLPFVVMGFVATQRGDNDAVDWLTTGLKCVPLVFLFDLVIAFLWLATGHGHFHI